jgi:Asp-tRNA(Asn)/Glu-tRNA(Gln) amidotransferase A subunit family amidase
MSDAARLTATEAARRIRAGRLSAVALMEACLGRIAEREPHIHAFAYLDPEAARRAAEKAAPGPLHGLPVGVKDVFDTADMPSEYNSPIWRGHRPRADAAAVAWARAAGGVVIGKTVTTEFAVRHPGPTVNPHNPAHTPGGSSSGSAAGVAECMFPFAFGTQTAGSVIRPAAFCGVVGYKPSFGMISRIGLKMMADTLDTVGVFARSVADCALLAGAVAGRDLGDPEAAADRPPRVGICRSTSWRHAAPETQALLPDVARRLSRAGAWVEDRELPEPFNAMEATHPVVQFAESARALGWEMTTARDQISAELLDLLEPAMQHGPETVDAARATIIRLRPAFPQATEGLDVLVTPAAPGEAPAGLGWTGDPAFNYIWTSLHVPCVTVSAGKGPKGLPLGIQIVGRHGEDRQLLAWAQWVAAAIG